MLPPMRARVIGIVVALAVSSAAHAQFARFISPSTHAPRPGEAVTLLLRESGKAGAGTWDDVEVGWSLVRFDGKQENFDGAPRAEGGGAMGSVRCTSPGAAIIGVDFKPRTVALDAEAAQNLAPVGAPPDRSKGPGSGEPVRVIQSAKTIIRVGRTAPGQSPNVTSKTGQQAELRPTFDPTGVGIGSDVPLVVYAGDGKAAGAKLIATHDATGEKQEFTANQAGVGVFHLSRAGVWRVEMRHLVANSNRRDGDPAWVLYTATLTFEAPEAREGAR